MLESNFPQKIEGEEDLNDEEKGRSDISEKKREVISKENEKGKRKKRKSTERLRNVRF